MKNKLFLTLTYCLVILGFFFGIASIGIINEEAISDTQNRFIILFLIGLALFVAAYFIFITLVHFDKKINFIINCVIISIVFLLSYCLPAIILFTSFFGNVSYILRI